MSWTAGLIVSVRASGHARACAMQEDSLMTNAEAAPAMPTQPLTAEELRKMDAYWRAANYLSVGQIYL